MEPLHHKTPRRVTIFPKDVVSITGRNERTARKLLQKLRIALRKNDDEFVTAKEFCTFYGIDEQLVIEHLNG